MIMFLASSFSPERIRRREKRGRRTLEGGERERYERERPLALHHLLAINTYLSKSCLRINLPDIWRCIAKEFIMQNRYAYAIYASLDLTTSSICSKESKT